MPENWTNFLESNWEIPPLWVPKQLIYFPNYIFQKSNPGPPHLVPKLSFFSWYQSFILLVGPRGRLICRRLMNLEKPNILFICKCIFVCKFRYWTINMVILLNLINLSHLSINNAVSLFLNYYYYYSKLPEKYFF